MVGWTETQSRQREGYKEKRGIKDSNCEMETDTNYGERKKKERAS